MIRTRRHLGEGKIDAALAVSRRQGDELVECDVHLDTVGDQVGEHAGTIVEQVARFSFALPG